MQQSTAQPDTPVYAELTAFVAIADANSFTQAAERLHRDATVLSKRLRALETRLGVRLLERTTRRVRLTEAGAGYLERAREILRAIDEADRDAIATVTGEPRGHLRLALPDTFGRLWLKPAIYRFMRAHPKVTIEAELSNRFVDLIGERFDLAVRLGELTDSRLVARRIAARRRLLCASPDYLSRRGYPGQPEELSRHDCLLFTRLRQPDRWDLQDASGERRRVHVSGPLQSEDSELLAGAAQAGLGIMLGTDWLLASALRSGELVRVLPGWEVIDDGAIYLVTPSGSAAASKTRAFGDWIARELREPPWQLAEERR
ncbi:MAG: LysR substrate-binding domain-containing protein [Burkholderiaceae bacterium]